MYCLAFLCCVAYALYIRAILSFSLCHHVCCSSVCSLVDFHLIDFLTCHLALCPMRRACADPARSLRLYCLVLSCWLYFFRSVVCRWRIDLGIQVPCPVDPRYWGIRIEDFFAWSLDAVSQHRRSCSGANRPRHRSLTLFLRLLTFCSGPAQSRSVTFCHPFL
jgi:hypothetical protein